MDDTIQILVFVITAIVFIASAIMKQKKKPNAKSSNFESIVESIFGIPQEIPRVEKEVYNRDYYRTEYNESDIIDNESFEVSREEMTNLVNKEGIKGIADKEAETIKEFQREDEETTPWFDARQAIIYSEIITPKYF